MFPTVSFGGRQVYTERWSERESEESHEAHALIRPMERIINLGGQAFDIELG